MSFGMTAVMRILAMFAVVACLGCGGDSGGAGGWTGAPLGSDGRHFRDVEGRIVLLRGINARVGGVFDVSFDDGRTPLEPIPTLTAADCTRMRQLGFNLLRLPINWSGIEPTRGHYDSAYLSAVHAAVDCARAAELYVVIDLHQDAYSKEIGEDGAPLWAIDPPPQMLLEGPLDDLETRRVSAQVQQAFETFFDVNDAAGLQADFIAMLRQVASEFADDPAVVGFELFNEPVATLDQTEAFHLRAAAAVREQAPDKLVFFEPPAIRNLVDFQPLASASFPTEGAVYSPHIYTFVFGNNPIALENLTKEALRPSVDAARAEADAYQTPLFIGEFGVGPDTTNADNWMAWQAELHDEYLASDAFWVWKEESQASWGLFDKVGDSWQERPQVVAWVSRMYPQRIAGSDVALRYDSATGVMTLNATGGGSHFIYIPEAAATTATGTCNGNPLALSRDAATGTAEVECDGELRVAPQP